MPELRWLDGGGAVLSVAADAPTIWWFSLDDPMTRSRAETVSPLPDEAALFARRQDAGERLIRRRLARLLLSTAGGCRPQEVSIGYDEAGAPTVSTPGGWHLSVAARWPEALIGIAPMRLGVDLEKSTADAPLTDVLTPGEARWLSGIGPNDRAAAFAACWAAKEAHAKWTGRPRELPPSLIETGGGSIVSSRFGATRCWRRRREALVAAVCIATR